MEFRYYFYILGLVVSSVSSIVRRLLSVGRGLVRRGIVARWLRLERDLLVDDDRGVGWYDGAVDVACGAVGLHLLHE